jgi:hypothetical protein
MMSGIFGTSVLGFCGCGAAEHYLGGSVAHKIVNGFANSAGALANKAFCLSHGFRAAHDLRNARASLSALNARSTLHGCGASIHRAKRKRG